MQRFVKYPTVESGPFNPESNNRFRVKIDTDNGNCYNLKNSYLLLNVQPDGNGTAPAIYTVGGDPVFSFQFGNGADYRQKYLPSCVIENCRLISDKVGVLESNVKRNLYTQTLKNYLYDAEQQKSLIKYGFSSDQNIETSAVNLPFLNQSKLGAGVSTQRPSNVIVPLSDLFQLGNYECIPKAKVGQLELEFELENNVNLFTDALSLNGSATEYACDDATPANADQQKTITITEVFHDIRECPFRKGQPVIVNYKVGAHDRHNITTIANTDFTINAGKITIRTSDDALDQAACTNIKIAAFYENPELETTNFIKMEDTAGGNTDLITTRNMTAAQSPFWVGMLLYITGLNATPARVVETRMVTTINEGGGKVVLTVDGANLDVLTKVYVQGVNSNPAGRPKPIVNRADVVLCEEPVPKDYTNMDIEYEKVTVEPFNKPDGLSYFEKVYHLDQGCNKFVLMNHVQSLFSEMQHLSSYRLYYDNKSNTSRAVVPRTSLYYDRILRSFGKKTNSLDEDENQTIVSDLVLAERSDPNLMVQMRATAGQNLGNGHILYLYKHVPTIF